LGVRSEIKIPAPHYQISRTHAPTLGPFFMISGIFIFNQKGDVLISRLYRQDLKRSIADVFRIHVLSSSDIRSPITTLGSTTFFHVKRENIYIVAVTKVNANAALVFEFLNKFVSDIGRSYFGKLDEECVKNNFVLIYELLDGAPAPSSFTD
jgi:AP-2 complex subunit mu-1